MTRLWPALSPRLPVREDLFGLRAVARFDFGCWQQSKRPPSQARQAAMQLSIRRWSKGIATLTVPAANSSRRRAPVKLVWLAGRSGVGKFHSAVWRACRRRQASVPPCLFAARPLSGIGLGSTAGPPSVCDAATLLVSNATAGAVVPAGLCNHPTS